MFKLLSLRSRFLVAPLIGIILTLVLYFTTNSIIQSQTHLFRQINDSNLPQISEIGRITILLADNHTQFTNLLLSSLSNPDEEEIYLRGKKILNSLHELEKKINQTMIPTDNLTMDRRQIFKNINHGFRRYRESCIDAIELSSVDGKRAMTELLNVNDAQHELNHQFLMLSTYYVRSLTEQSSQIQSILYYDNAATTLTIILILIMVFVSVYFSNRMTADLGLVNKALIDLSKGNKEINLPDKVDEYIQALTSAVYAFKKTLEENDEQRVTLLKNIEEIADNKERYHSLLDLSPTAIISIDERQHIVIFNKVAETMFGHDQSSVLGQPLAVLMPKHYQKEHLLKIKDFQYSDENIAMNVLKQPVIAVRKNGDNFYVEANIAKVKLAGEVLIMAAITDVSQRMKDEDEIDRYRNHLEEMVSKRTFELNQSLRDLTETQEQLIKAEKDARAASRIKSEFLAHMSHEIRTPMNGIIVMAELLQDISVSDVHRDYVKTIKDSSSALMIILNDILDISKVESGKMQLEYRRFKLQDMVHEVCAAFRIEADKKYIRFNCLIDDNVPKNIISDSTRLRQVLFNVLSNAIKFTPEKGRVSLSVSLGEDIHNSSQCIANIVFKIEDTGIGIPQNKQDAIFEAFVQADNTITRNFGGTGLGLKICKQLCQLMGGGIRLQSVEGGGTTIIFNIPAKTSLQDADIIPEALIESKIPARNIRILLVEDNHVNQKVATALLEKLGYHVGISENGQLAIEQVLTNSYDIVLMDCQMPVMDGYEATCKLREIERYNNLPIIAMTASATTEERKKCKESGMNDFIAKPITSNGVKEVLSRWH